MYEQGPFFTTVYGRRLFEEVADVAPSPYLVVVNEDIWHLFRDRLQKNLGHLYTVKSMEYDVLVQDEASLPDVSSVIGIGGGTALDAAKFFAWRRNLRLFQMPTSISTNAAFSHRAGVRIKGSVHYLGWAIPEVVYVDYDAVKSAPVSINRAGVGDIFCMHDAVYDWELATRRNKEKVWLWNDELVEVAKAKVRTVRENAKEINQVTDAGIRLVMETHKYTGATYHNAGWNGRWLEGSDHFFFYCLEQITHKKFVHGEPVCLGVVLVSSLADNDPDGMLQSIKEIGVRIRPDELGVSEEDVVRAFLAAGDYVEKNWGLAWYSVLNEKKADAAFVRSVLKRL